MGRGYSEADIDEPWSRNYLRALRQVEATAKRLSPRRGT
jgi:microsomal dipeptidase-like Zn-dependent dipeptidase